MARSATKSLRDIRPPGVEITQGRVYALKRKCQALLVASLCKAVYDAMLRRIGKLSPAISGGQFSYLWEYGTPGKQGQQYYSSIRYRTGLAKIRMTAVAARRAFV